MVYKNKTAVNKIYKQPINIKFPLATSFLTASGVTLIDELNNKQGLQKNTVSQSDIDASKKLSLLQYLRLYTIFTLPVFDFLIFYVIMYIINCVYLKFNTIFVILSSIILTIMFNTVFNSQFKMSPIVFVVLSLCLYYLLSIKFTQVR